MSSVARSVNNNVWETPRRTVQCVAYKARTKPQSIDYRNYYSALTFGDMDIAIDSGASDSFGDIDMPGTNQQRVLPHESITMVSATNNQQHSVVIDEFDVSLPKEARQYHVMDKGAVRQPLLSVGRACDTGCKVTFDKYDIRIMTQDEPKVSRALLVFTRRLGLKTRKIAPHKTLVKPEFLPFLSTSTPKNTMSMRHILTSYPSTKISAKAYHSQRQRNWLTATDCKRTHKLSTTNKY